MLQLQKCFSLSGFISFDPPSTDKQNAHFPSYLFFCLFSDATVQREGRRHHDISEITAMWFFFFFPSVRNENKVCTATRIKIFYLQFWNGSCFGVFYLVLTQGASVSCLLSLQMWFYILSRLCPCIFSSLMSEVEARNSTCKSEKL